METVPSPGFWWLKTSKSFPDNPKIEDPKGHITSTPKQSDDPSTISSSLREFLEKERAVQSPGEGETDIGSIIEEINKLAAESPLGPYEIKDGDRSIEEIMKEAEKIYLESSKSFEQLSVRSRTSANLSVSFNDSPKSTPTPKSASPLPLDPVRVTAEEVPKESQNENNDDSYSEDFTEGDGSEPEIPSSPPPVFDKSELDVNTTKINVFDFSIVENNERVIIKSLDEELKLELPESEENEEDNFNSVVESELKFQNTVEENDYCVPQIDLRENGGIFETVNDFENANTKETIENLQEENKKLMESITVLKVQLEETSRSLEITRQNLNVESLKSPEINLELEKAFEELKDTKETNTALNLQLDHLNKTHQTLKTTYDELLLSNNNLEKRLLDAETILSKYKIELQNVQEHRDKLLESETNLAKLLEIEKLQVKSLKAQNEKDARCIQDLNRQVKEMERIIARKHPDSVSALIVAAKSDQTENNLTARKLLEDRIKNLEGEVVLRDQQSSKVFLEVQEKFAEMKNKYESHIEDLELHVSDLKNQLKRKVDTFDVYTQTFFDDQKIPVKEAKDVSVQTVSVRVQTQKAQPVKKVEKVEGKEETHLLATIRGFQADLVNKEKVVMKLQKELDEAKKTNKRLQKEREGSLKNIAERREFRSYPEKLAAQLKSNAPAGGGESDGNSELGEELSAIKTERDKMRVQLCRIEEDYQNLKSKRLFDLSALQQAHENEIASYISNITPLREQLEVHQLTINTLQEQLRVAKEQVEILTVERDDLYNRLKRGTLESRETNANGNEGMDDLRNLPPHQKVAVLEQRYQERERRLRAIVHGLAQKNVANQGCQQCSQRQQQLILYKTELDQLLATLRTLT